MNIKIFELPQPRSMVQNNMSSDRQNESTGTWNSVRGVAFGVPASLYGVLIK